MRIGAHVLFSVLIEAGGRGLFEEGDVVAGTTINRPWADYTVH